MKHTVWLSIALLVGVACQQPERKPALVSAAPASNPPIASAPSATPSDPPGFYLGRQIAPTMSHEGADWLIRPEREAEESSARMLKELGLKPGQTACDFGAGNGFHTLVMAKSVAPNGRAIAIDIQPEMLELLRGRAKAAAVANVDTVLATATDPKLGVATCDLILLADVYHELDDPAGALAHLRRALRPEGVLALLEFRAEDPKVPIKPEHKMSRAQISKELEANGFILARSFDELPWQHLMFFASAVQASSDACQSDADCVLLSEDECCVPTNCDQDRKALTKARADERHLLCARKDCYAPARKDCSVADVRVVAACRQERCVLFEPGVGGTGRIREPRPTK